jgi:alpha-D-ribose 1-methylphosphonate 5-triphosphate diphosphatase
MPGLIELHTDNIETVLAPRPGVRWPLELAAQYHDRIVIAAGITTVCDAIALGDTLPGSSRLEHYAPIIDIISRGVAAGRYAADHLIHLRCELVYDELLEVVARFIDNPLVAILSVMDHTPGQRQFANLAKFEQYYAGKHGLDRAGVARIIEERLRDQEKHAAGNRDAVVAMARKRGIPLATHDDETLEHVAEAVREGAVVAEFPTTREAARAAHEAGLLVLMGSPNVVLGGSQSGNVSALELALDGLVDIFSSDYVPQSLLQAPFAVAAATGAPLYETMRSVTSTPARALRLEDRGELAIGKRADLLFVDVTDGQARVRGVISNGLRVA